ncbi:MAG: hypothetical protein JSW66_15945 [Phycisphaerales bacterium]|nr:MAG: hypothetical protein JSW66_15945 [Phycisphaerales bacterium]
MNESPETNEEACRPCWQNCGVEADAEILAIDTMEDALTPVDEHTTRIRELITRFESCYHEADKEAESIIEAIGAGRCPEQPHTRPPGRQRELENSRAILSQWCEDPGGRRPNPDVGAFPADELLSSIGQATPLKIWQVRRIVDKVDSALDPGQPYHNMALDVGGYGEPASQPAGEYYRDDATFLERTRETFIHDTVEGRPARISLALAIDLLMPCHWDFAGGLVIILKAIGGDLHPKQPFACCSRNMNLSPLCPRLKAISNTLRLFWKGQEQSEDIDCKILAALGTATPARRWLAASLDKTIRLQLQSTSDCWLKFC